MFALSCPVYFFIIYKAESLEHTETIIKSCTCVWTFRLSFKGGLYVHVCLQKAAELPRRSLSPVLSAVVWTLLSCGILLSFCFLLFTLRFKNNR